MTVTHNERGRKKYLDYSYSKKYKAVNKMTELFLDVTLYHWASSSQCFEGI
jgi:hypothetical protein